MVEADDRCRRYALLIAPSANRVYADRAAGLVAAELGVLGETVLGGRVDRIESELIGGVEYLCFDGRDLTAADISHMSDLSAAYALFTRSGPADDPLLRPVELTRSAGFDDDLLTIQKYAGKTNEQFTALLMNVTVWSGRSGATMTTTGPDRRLQVLDPLCGRGTTLNQALMYGWDAAGLDIDEKDFDAYRGFIETWLRRKRLKHQTSVFPVRREKKTIGRRMEISLAPSKDAYKAGDRLALTVVNADTRRAGDFFKPESFDVIVADAPYGVQHGSRTPRKGADASADAGPELSRRPLELLHAAVPGWVRLLRPGGTLGLSWNTQVASRADLSQVLTDAGLVVCSGGPYEQFAHRVDQAIIRDLIVGRA